MPGFQPFVAFAETAKHGSFAAAARQLGSTPSTLAKAVGRLEATLGVKLFYRTTRQVSLTPDGERLYQRCQRVLAELDALHNEAAGSRAEPSGLLRIDAPIVYGKRYVLPLLADLIDRHPGLELDLRLQDGYVDLVRDGIDLAVRVGDLHDSTLVAHRIDSQVSLLVASPAYLQRAGQPRQLTELAGHSALTFRQPSNGRIRPWQFRDGASVQEISPPPRLQFNDGEAIIEAARLGLGICQVPDNMVSAELAHGELIELLPEYRPASLPINVVYPSGRLLPARIGAVIGALRSLAEQRKARP